VTSTGHDATRIVIVGGGIAGLAAAARLASAGLAVTLFEASKLGSAASTRNQGWLHSGALYATQAPDYARLCRQALETTLAFCPDCVEPLTPSMLYLISRPDTLAHPWTAAWEACGIEYREQTVARVFDEFPGIDRTRVQHAFELPDRAIRIEVLLERLASVAVNAGAEIRTETQIRQLQITENQVRSVVTAQGEEISSRYVVLAGGASGISPWAELHSKKPGMQTDHELVALKTHLLAVRPSISPRPFCVVDDGGFNHLPHLPSSVFGSGRWDQAASSDDQGVDSRHAAQLRESIHRYFPRVEIDGPNVQIWSGTMLQAMQVDQIHPGGALWPALIDHARLDPRVENLVSIFPGRATLWADLAEKTRVHLLERIAPRNSVTAHPPWA
jgi:glycine/D-amino acid oxidase-like deaminating enzyme